jgi:LPS export ABC transporter protein LptC
LYFQAGKNTSTLTARRGFIKTDTNDMRAEDHVVMVSQEGVVLKTEKLIWNHQSGKLYTDLPVEVDREGSILVGRGLRADSELKHIEILADVQIKVRSLKDLNRTLSSPLPAGTP